MKVVKSYSLDLDVVQMLENHHKDAYGDIGSKSKTVNEAIRWYMGGTHELVDELELMKKIIAARKPTESERTNLSWWRRLLLGK